MIHKGANRGAFCVIIWDPGAIPEKERYHKYKQSDYSHRQGHRQTELKRRRDLTEVFNRELQENADAELQEEFVKESQNEIKAPA